MEDKDNYNIGWGGYIIILIVIVLIAYIPDWSFIDGSITGYEVVNFKDTPNKCEPVSARKFKPSVSKQIVLAESYSGAQTYKDCEIFDRENWQCKEVDSSTIGFRKGMLFYENLENKIMNWENIGNYRQVSRLEYLICSLSYYSNFFK